MSYKAHHRRLFTPLWSSSLGITNTCQYTSDQETTETSERHIQESGQRLKSVDVSVTRDALKPILVSDIGPI